MFAAAKGALPAFFETKVEPGGASLVQALGIALEHGHATVLAAPTRALAFDESTRRAITREVVPRALRSGARLYLLGIGAGELPLFATQLARATGGSAVTAANTAEAKHALRGALDGLAPARGLSAGEFLVAGGSEPVTLLVRIGVEGPLILESPLGQVIDVQTFSPDVAWFQEGKTALITLRAPTPGRWRVEGSTQSVDVYHDLRLDFRKAEGASVDAVGTTLTARLIDAVGDIDEPLLWELSRLRAWLQDADTAQPLDVTPASAAVPPGNPTVRVPSEIDPDARVVAVLEGRTFTLKARHPPDGAAAVGVTLVPLQGGLVFARVKLGAFRRTAPDRNPSDSLAVAALSPDRARLRRRRPGNRHRR